MRTLTRKLLSLLLAFTMVCAMVPAAMAADGEPETTPPTEGQEPPEDPDGGNDEGENPPTEPCDHSNLSYDPNNDGTHNVVCKDCGKTIEEDEACTAGSKWESSGDNHYKVCTECGGHVSEGKHTPTNDAPTFDETGCQYTCSVCEKPYVQPHDWSEWKDAGDGKKHSRSCKKCNYSELELHTFGQDALCTVCGARDQNPSDSMVTEITGTPDHRFTVKLDPGESETFSISAKAINNGTDVTEQCDITYEWSLDGSVVADTDDSYSLPTTLSVGNHTVQCKVRVQYYDFGYRTTTCTWRIVVGQDVLSLNEDKIVLNGRNDKANLEATVAPGYDANDVVWSITKGSKYVDLDETRGEWTTVYPISNGDAVITASLTADGVTYTAQCNVEVINVNTDISVGATVFNTNPGYALGDEDDDGDTSIVDQIRDEIDDITDGDEDLKYVKFYSPVDFKDEGELDVSTKESYYLDPGKNDEDISDVVFIPDEEYKGKVTFTFLAVDTANDEYEGEIVFDVQEGTASAGDIIYPAKSGDDVEFDVNDFEDFWEDKYSKGSLDYVTFGSISSSRGDLVDADGDKVSSRTKYYADPTSKQADLDGVTFEPGRNTKTTVTIDFTAHGTNNSKRDAELSGTVVILYTEKDPEAIVYSSTGKNITLDADDFLDNYKDTMGSSASNIQIQFLEVPSNGTLYYNYNERTEKGTELTSKNVANYTFSTSSRASRSIEDVTYVPDSRGRSDTVRFACYTSGGDLRYYGEVTFGQTVQNVTVNMTSTSSGVTFQASTFFNADDALLSANTISFGTPSSGTLYKNWNGTSGTRVTASDMFSYVASVTGNASISTVTYVPVAGYSGTVTIPFSAYGAAGGIVSGTVSIRVTATTPTTIFTDVPTTGSQAWAYPFINRLATAGVVSGVTPTTYGPKQTVKWGEALKMVLLGAGHPAQVEGTGSNWASGYLTYAVNNGIVSNTNINLSSNITRLEMAELAAKALGMSPASRINTGIVGPTDTTNGYVYALYNAGIVGGDSSSGQNRYNGGSTLLRDEMAKIVCGVMDNA